MIENPYSFTRSNVPKLYNFLLNQKMTPAIVFSISVKHVEGLLKNLVEHLQSKNTP
jgi:superfamily II RNA helicase